MKIEKYFIDENLAKLAKEMNSFDDYKENSETHEYLTLLYNFENEINLLIEKAKIEISEEKEKLIVYYMNKYSQKLANAINKLNSIKTRCPSILITGAGHFPVDKKLKQNQAMDNFFKENGNLFDTDMDNNYYYGKIYNTIFSSTNNNVQAIKKLEIEIKQLEKIQKEMEDKNNYYKQNKTMVGYENLIDWMAQKIDKDIENSYYKEKQPFSNRVLKSNLNRIEKLKSEIEAIINLKNDTTMYDDTNNGIKIVKNSEIMRIQIFFNVVPNEDIRNMLKKHAFKWSPSNKAWQRQLTQNAIYATEKLIKCLFNGVVNAKEWFTKEQLRAMHELAFGYQF